MATKKKQKETPEQDWRSRFISQFPQYARLVDGGAGEAEARSVFGNDLVDLILDVAKNPQNYSLDTDAGLMALDGKIKATTYWNQTADKAKQFDSMTDADRAASISAIRAQIASKYGDLGLTISELDKIARDVTRFGMTGVVADNYIYSTVGTTRRSKADVVSSLDGMALKNLAKSYGYNPGDLDDQVYAILTGNAYNGQSISEDSLRKKGILTAKSAYFHLAPQLDAGLTLKDIFDPYRQKAAQVLEMSEESIDMMDGKFAAAFGSENGRPLSMTEWENMLRTDDRYGYKYTKQAKNDARQMAMTLAKAFGAVE